MQYVYHEACRQANDENRAACSGRRGMAKRGRASRQETGRSLPTSGGRQLVRRRPCALQRESLIAGSMPNRRGPAQDRRVRGQSRYRSPPISAPGEYHLDAAVGKSLEMVGLLAEIADVGNHYCVQFQVWNLRACPGSFSRTSRSLSCRAPDRRLPRSLPARIQAHGLSFRPSRRSRPGLPAGRCRRAAERFVHCRL